MNNALERNDLGDLLYAYVAAVVMTLAGSDWYDPTVPLEIKLRPQFVIKNFVKGCLNYSNMDDVVDKVTDVETIYKLLDIPHPDNIFNIREGMTGFQIFSNITNVLDLPKNDGASYVIKKMPTWIIRTLVCACFFDINAKAMSDLIYKRISEISDRMSQYEEVEQVSVAPGPDIDLVIKQIRDKRQSCAFAIARCTSMIELQGKLMHILGSGCVIGKPDASFSTSESDTVLHDGISVKFTTPSWYSKVTDDDEWAFDGTPHKRSSFKVRMMTCATTASHHVEVMTHGSPWTRVLDAHESNLF
jgi:hypothetical protein